MDNTLPKRCPRCGKVLSSNYLLSFWRCDGNCRKKARRKRYKVKTNNTGLLTRWIERNKRK
jgi:ribosomal protein L37AE/L43A